MTRATHLTSLKQSSSDTTAAPVTAGRESSSSFPQAVEQISSAVASEHRTER